MKVNRVASRIKGPEDVLWTLISIIRRFHLHAHAQLFNDHPKNVHHASWHILLVDPKVDKRQLFGCLSRGWTGLSCFRSDHMFKVFALSLFWTTSRLMWSPAPLICIDFIVVATRALKTQTHPNIIRNSSSSSMCWACAEHCYHSRLFLCPTLRQHQLPLSLRLRFICPVRTASMGWLRIIFKFAYGGG